MLPNPLLRKLVQISEEALPPIHGNDAFILTQQDVRKTEDSRFFIMSKVLPNGDLKPINSLGATECLQPLFPRPDAQCQKVLNSLLEFLNCKRNASREDQQVASQQYSAFNTSSLPQPMEVSMPADTVASINQQLEWNKCINKTSSSFPIHYSQGTSTTDLLYHKPVIKDNFTKTCNRCKMWPHCENRVQYFDKSTNVEGEIQHFCHKKSNEVLDARQQLKKKKISYCLT